MEDVKIPVGQDVFSLLQSVYSAGWEEEEVEEKKEEEESVRDRGYQNRKNMDNVAGWSNMQM